MNFEYTGRAQRGIFYSKNILSRFALHLTLRGIELRLLVSYTERFVAWLLVSLGMEDSLFTHSKILLTQSIMALMCITIRACMES